MKEELAKRLRACREKLVLTQTVFGERIGAKKTTYAEWEAGKRTPSPYAIAQIEAVFGFSASWILRGPGLEPKRLADPSRVAEITFDLWSAARDAGIELQRSPAVGLAVELAEKVDTDRKVAFDAIVGLYKAKGT